MQPAGGEAQNGIAGHDRAAVDDLAPRRNAYAEAGQVVIARRVEVGQDRRFAAQQGAVGLDAAVAHALHDLFQQQRIVLGHRHIIEKEQWLGAAAQGIVDAHRHQIDAHGRVSAHRAGDFQLGAHPVGAGHQHGVLVVAGEEPVGEVEAEQPGETALQRHHARTERAIEQLGQPGHRLSVNVQIDTGVLVSDFRHRVSCNPSECVLF